RLISEVAKELDLNIQYFSEGRIKTTEVYKDKSPIKLKQLNPTISTGDTLRANFKVKILSATDFEISEEDKEFNKKSKFGNRIKSPIGEIILIPNASNIQKNIGDVYYVKVNPFMQTVVDYRNRITADALGTTGRKNNVITLSLIDNVKE